MGETSLAGSLLGARVQFGPIFVASAVRSIMARASVQVVEGAGTVAPKTSPSAPGRFDCQPHEGAMNIVWGTSSRADDISQDPLEDNIGWATRRDDDHAEWGSSLTSATF